MKDFGQIEKCSVLREKGVVRCFLCLCAGLCAEIARTIARFWATSGAASAMGEGVEKNTRQIHIFGVKKL
ncbi:MAG: hypothetical protein HPZ97_03685 [Oscillospiraceae bacterium]|nr:hypothetical protein [Oscillospiraceae bacterium]